MRVAEKIQQRRLQILVNSYIYYKMGESRVSDATWDAWAKELVQLQREYGDIAEQVRFAEAFKTWDASTGAFLPLDDAWVVRTAKYLMRKSVPSIVQKKKTGKQLSRRLF